MTIGHSRDLHARLARLEQAAAGAGCALACAHQSAEELHRALIGQYLRHRAPKQAGIFAGALLLAALFILV